jgi:hypothetical protein
VKDTVISKLQGPGSKKIKYEASLCSDCNSNRTQPYDRAFDKFSEFVLRNEEVILMRRVIDFSEVYGDSFQADQLNLFKYFVKLFGCDLIEHGHAVPDDLVQLLNEEHFLTRLKISFAVNEDKLLFPKPTDRPVGIGELHTTVRNIETRDEPKYRWHTYFSFLHVYYWYWMAPDGPYGAPWIADAQYLYLGSYFSLTPEQRTEFLRLRDSWEHNESS